VPLLRPFQASVDTIKETTEELCSVTTLYAVSNKVTQLHSGPSSSRGASPNIVILDAEEGGKKKCRQCRQETATTANDDDGINTQVGSSVMACVVAIADSSNRQARSPTNHFEKLLEETCLNHAYRIKHKLRDCGMLKNFIGSGLSPEAWKSMRSPTRVT
jgi:hypothetical protein